jgi:hypothetical protein
MCDSMTLTQLQKRFRTEDDCVEYLKNLRWPQGFMCPNCSHDVGYQLTSRPLIQCAVCRLQTSVTAGTVFHKTRIPLVNWFWIIYLVVHDKGGASAMRLAKQLGMYYKTVWHILQKVRYAMGSRDAGITLAGFIELDEAVIGPHARKTGRPRTKPPSSRGPRLKRLGRKPKSGQKRKTQTEVVVMVERENAQAGHLAMKVIQNRTRDDVREVVDQRTDENRQSFKTDACAAHYVVKSMGHDLELLKLSGTPLSCDELPVVHRAISLLKRFLLGTYHGVSSRYLQLYLHEFCFRWNRRDTEQSLCQSLLRACACALPMSYAELRL